MNTDKPRALRAFACIAAAAALLPLTACASGSASAVSTSAASAPAAAQESAIDLTGGWVLTVESPNGTGTRDIMFRQEGNELTGTIASSMAAGELEGTVEGDEVYFVAVIAMDSGMFEVTYQARIANGMLVDGTVDFGSYGGGTFTGKRKGAGVSW